MCWSKEDLLLWINMEKYDRRVMLRLRTTPDKKAYNEFFTIEYPHGGAKGAEVLYTLPFNKVKTISYESISGTNLYKINLDVVNGEEELQEITVERHCFNYFAFKKMMKTHAKSVMKADR